jgi:zinc transport system substrate-binding protein
MRFSCLATIAGILLTAQAAVAGTLFPKVVVTPAPLKPYVDEILAGVGESQSLLRAGQDIHSFALAPTQAKMLAEADIIIVPDLGMNPFLKKLLAKNTHAKVIELTALSGAEPLPYAPTNPWLKGKIEQEEKKPTAHKEDAHGDEHEHEHAHESVKTDAPVYDPHLWLDPERMAAIATPLAKAIGARAPEAGPAIEANARALTRHLRADVTPALQAMLNKLPRTENAMTQPEIPFLTYHAAYQYFLERFGLEHYGELMQRPEETTGAKTKADMLTAADNTRIRCLIGEQESVLMARVAKSTGAKVILLSPEQLVARNQVDALGWMKNDYDRFLYATAKAFAGCL